MLVFYRYPDNVMVQVSHLARDLGKEYQLKRKDKLKRTFVTASNAAEDKVKRNKKPKYNEKNKA